MLILQVREHQPVISILDNLVAFSGVGFGDFAFFFCWVSLMSSCLSFDLKLILLFHSMLLDAACFPLCFLGVDLGACVSNKAEVLLVCRNLNQYLHTLVRVSRHLLF